MTTGVLVTYTATTGTVAGLYPKIADAIQQIQSNIYRLLGWYGVDS